MSVTIKIKTGEGVPGKLDKGEPAFDTKYKIFYIGDASGTPIPIKSIVGLNNIVDGDSNGSIRSINAAVEDDTYKLGENAIALGNNTKASGMNAYSEGRNTISEGYDSHAEGLNTIAHGHRSHSEGSNTKAFGTASHTEGLNTKTGEFENDIYTNGSGAYAHAEGDNTNAVGEASHSEGHDTISYGTYSHTEGDSSEAGGDSSHAEGFFSTANGQFSHAEGGFTIANWAYSHAEGSSTISKGFASHAEGDTSKAGGRASHTEGYRTTTGNFDIYGNYVDNTGDYSHAEGSYTQATGEASHAEGVSSSAFGKASHTEGITCGARGDYSHAEGSYTQATGDSSHTEGFFSTAWGESSHAEGCETDAYGDSSHAEGGFTIANGQYSHAEGDSTQAQGNSAHSEGSKTKAGMKGYYWSSIDFTNNTITLTKEQGYIETESFNIGYKIGDIVSIVNNSKYPDCSEIIAIDKNVITVNSFPFTSVVELEALDMEMDDYSIFVSTKPDAGEVPLGYYAHAEGEKTIALERASHAEGYRTVAQGYYSHSEGYNTQAAGQYQHVQGKFNVIDTENKYAHIVGNGTGTGDEDRSNAHTVDWDGNAWFAGEITVGEDEKKIATEDLVKEVNDKIVQPDWEQYDDTKPDYINNKPETLNNLLNAYISDDNVFVLENIDGNILAPNYVKKTKTIYSDNTVCEFEFNSMDASEMIINAEAVESISFVFGNEIYSDQYASAIYFNSGETPTAIDYTDSGILNWVGTDCVTDNGISIFQPSANTHYDIVFYFNGTQLIGLVNGYVPAIGNVE